MGSEVLVAVDPGLRELGLALFHGQTLVACHLVRSPERTVRGPVAWRAMAKAVVEALGGPRPEGVVVTEYPQAYRAQHQKGDQADLIELAGAVGAVSYALGAERLVGYLPREWKGQVPKEVHNRRIRSKLTDAELAVLTAIRAGALEHNVVDAIGIGLVHLGRLARP